MNRTRRGEPMLPVVATMLLMGVMVTACAASDDENTSKQTQNVPPLECSQLTDSECMGAQECAWLWGMPINAEENCLDYKRFAACADAFECTSGQTDYAMAPSGQVWVFGSNSCAPPGWAHVELLEPPGKTCPLAPIESCSELVGDDCGRYPQCGTIWGNPVDEAAQCIKRVQFVACTDYQVCGGAITHARDDQGHLWQFTSTCIPPGWATVGSIGYLERECGQPDPPEDCSVLSAKVCDADSYCWSLRASPVNESEQCLEPVEFLKCMDAGIGCDDAMHVVRDPSGKLWQFSHGCIPAGWGEHTSLPILDAPCGL